MKRKKHIESYFSSNDKKFIYYFKPSLKKKNNIDFANYPLSFSNSGLKYLGPTCFIGIDPLKSVVRSLKTYFRKFKIKKNISFRFFINPDVILTSKPREIRMGKGKGQPNSSKVALLHHGQIIFTLNFKLNKKNNYLAPLFLNTCASKLPFKFQQIQKF